MTFADKVKYMRLKLYLDLAQLAKEICVLFAQSTDGEIRVLSCDLQQWGKFDNFCGKRTKENF